LVVSGFDYIRSLTGAICQGPLSNNELRSYCIDNKFYWVKYDCNKVGRFGRKTASILFLLWS
jgi:hypothetical protein